MARIKAAESKEAAVTDYRHADKRKHIPPAGLAAQKKAVSFYARNDHLEFSGVDYEFKVRER